MAVKKDNGITAITAWATYVDAQVLLENKNCSSGTQNNFKAFTSA
jgi:hypothetical protein